MNEGRLEVELQEFRFEVFENPLSERAVIGRNDAAAGHGMNDIQLVEQPAGRTVPLDGRIAQRLQGAVRQCGGARPPAREESDKQKIAARRRRSEALRSIAVIDIDD